MKDKEVIVISDFAAISALGSSKSILPSAYAEKTSCLQPMEIEGAQAFASELSDSCNELLETIRSDSKYKKLDRSVLMAILAGRLATSDMQFCSDKKFLINIGSSRGATSLFEKYHRHFLERGTVPVQTSPTTTLGNISSWVAQDLNCNAECLSTSVTCSTALQAIGNSIAWLRSGMADIAIAGASEAPLTGFTIAQMQALRIYAENNGLEYPCQPCALEYSPGAGMALGEGAAIFVLEKSSIEKANVERKVIIESFGFGREQIEHATAMTENGDSLYRAMSMAQRGLPEGASVDLIMLHAPGTVRGDASELAAVKRIFCDSPPILLSNKWKLGHTFGAAGALNIEHAINVLRYQSYAEFPYPVRFRNLEKEKIKRVMINAAGFGGNAASIIISLGNA